MALGRRVMINCGGECGYYYIKYAEDTDNHYFICIEEGMAAYRYVKIPKTIKLKKEIHSIDLVDADNFDSSPHFDYNIND